MSNFNQMSEEDRIRLRLLKEKVQKSIAKAENALEEAEAGEEGSSGDAFLTATDPPRVEGRRQKTILSRDGADNGTYKWLNPDTNEYEPFADQNSVRGRSDLDVYYPQDVTSDTQFIDAEDATTGGRKFKDSTSLGEGIGSKMFYINDKDKGYLYGPDERQLDDAEYFALEDNNGAPGVVRRKRTNFGRYLGEDSVPTMTSFDALPPEKQAELMKDERFRTDFAEKYPERFKQMMSNDANAKNAAAFRESNQAATGVLSKFWNDHVKLELAKNTLMETIANMGQKNGFNSDISAGLNQFQGFMRSILRGDIMGAVGQTIYGSFAAMDCISDTATSFEGAFKVSYGIYSDKVKNTAKYRQMEENLKRKRATEAWIYGTVGNSLYKVLQENDPDDPMMSLMQGTSDEAVFVNRVNNLTPKGMASHIENMMKVREDLINERISILEGIKVKTDKDGKPILKDGKPQFDTVLYDARREDLDDLNDRIRAVDEHISGVFKVAKATKIFSTEDMKAMEGNLNVLRAGQEEWVTRFRNNEMKAAFDGMDPFVRGIYDGKFKNYIRNRDKYQTLNGALDLSIRKIRDYVNDRMNLKDTYDGFDPLVNQANHAKLCGEAQHRYKVALDTLAKAKNISDSERRNLESKLTDDFKVFCNNHQWYKPVLQKDYNSKGFMDSSDAFKKIQEISEDTEEKYPSLVRGYKQYVKDNQKYEGLVLTDKALDVLNDIELMAQGQDEVPLTKLAGDEFSDMEKEFLREMYERAQHRKELIEDILPGVAQTIAEIEHAHCGFGRRWNIKDVSKAQKALVAISSDSDKSSFKDRLCTVGLFRTNASLDLLEEMVKEVDAYPDNVKKWSAQQVDTFAGYINRMTGRKTFSPRKTEIIKDRLLKFRQTNKGGNWDACKDRATIINELATLIPTLPGIGEIQNNLSPEDQALWQTEVNGVFADMILNKDIISEHAIAQIIMDGFDQGKTPEQVKEEILSDAMDRLEFLSLVGYVPQDSTLKPTNHNSLRDIMYDRVKEALGGHTLGYIESKLWDEKHDAELPDVLYDKLDAFIRSFTEGDEDDKWRKQFRDAKSPDTWVPDEEEEEGDSAEEQNGTTSEEPVEEKREESPQEEQPAEEPTPSPVNDTAEFDKYMQYAFDRKGERNLVVKIGKMTVEKKNAFVRQMMARGIEPIVVDALSNGGVDSQLLGVMSDLQDPTKTILDANGNLLPEVRVPLMKLLLNTDAAKMILNDPSLSRIILTDANYIGILPVGGTENALYKIDHAFQKYDKDDLDEMKQFVKLCRIIDKITGDDHHLNSKLQGGLWADINELKDVGWVMPTQSEGDFAGKWVENAFGIENEANTRGGQEAFQIISTVLEEGMQEDMASTVGNLFMNSKDGTCIFKGDKDSKSSLNECLRGLNNAVSYREAAHTYDLIVDLKNKGVLSEGQYLLLMGDDTHDGKQEFLSGEIRKLDKPGKIQVQKWLQSLGADEKKKLASEIAIDNTKIGDIERDLLSINQVKMGEEPPSDEDIYKSINSIFYPSLADGGVALNNNYSYQKLAEAFRKTSQYRVYTYDMLRGKQIDALTMAAIQYYGGVDVAKPNANTGVDTLPANMRRINIRKKEVGKTPEGDPIYETNDEGEVKYYYYLQNPDGSDGPQSILSKNKDDIQSLNWRELIPAFDSKQSRIKEATNLYIDYMYSSGFGSTMMGSNLSKVMSLARHVALSNDKFDLAGASENASQLDITNEGQLELQSRMRENVVRPALAMIERANRVVEGQILTEMGTIGTDGRYRVRAPHGLSPYTYEWHMGEDQDGYPRVEGLHIYPKNISKSENTNDNKGYDSTAYIYLSTSKTGKPVIKLSANSPEEKSSSQLSKEYALNGKIKSLWAHIVPALIDKRGDIKQEQDSNGEEETKP